MASSLSLKIGAPIFKCVYYEPYAPLYLSTKNSLYHTKKVYTVHTRRLLSAFPDLCSSKSRTSFSVWKNFSASGLKNAALTRS